ncbi:methylated-DNA--[protein]-cysteine S-methyltransferase [Amycolatopsis alba]|uniref:Methylated-DNA--protein-cysteine methyltransferase n=1 Tax=Amycolatopsis alba DSM 44262 TaxID=1125972 RepID=A0A229RB32_AMYAL|nr:methylated-DNA--[protein]-cysteine S-methyltransferase [Amycolatopsis alba]OXM43846.1 methylated-DNA--[protein]-cysteine S-methyltransferase [Amycolatopsis alba DSM 44262]
MSTVHTIIDSPIGDLTMVTDDDNLTRLYFPHHWGNPDRSAFGPRDDHRFENASRQLTSYFAGDRTDFDLPIHADGDDFHHAVWAHVATIPYGATTTYGDIATALGDPRLARDVGAAVGRNPLCILIPCHRVVGKNGTLTGYAGGLTRKQFLLELEKPAVEERGQLW